MLEIRPSCENCNKPLPNTASDAMICTFECTFCEDCVDNVLNNVCPNCGGGFEKRPTRPSSKLQKYPPVTAVTYSPVDMNKFGYLKHELQNVDPRKR